MLNNISLANLDYVAIYEGAYDNPKIISSPVTYTEVDANNRGIYIDQFDLFIIFNYL